MLDHTFIDTMTENELKQTCDICGDMARGKNFGVMSCEACKAFFRRNVGRKIVGRCSGECIIDHENRCYCKACRLKKCLAKGMKAELIKKGMNVYIAQQHQQQQKLQQARGMGSVSSSSSLSPAEASPLSPQSSSSQSPDVMAPYLTSYRLPEADHKLLDELEKAFELSSRIPTQNTLPTVPTLEDFVSKVEDPIRRVVAFSKTLSLFKSLTMDDQLALVKGCMVEAITLRSIIHFSPTEHCWVSPQMMLGGMTASKVPEATVTSSSKDMEWDERAKAAELEKDVQIKHEPEEQMMRRINLSSEAVKTNEAKETFRFYIKFAKELREMIGDDTNLLNFLTVLSLFASDRDGIVQSNRIDDIQIQYSQTLQHYIWSQYPEQPNLFYKIMQKLTDIRVINAMHSQLLDKIDINVMGPLPRELYDVNLKSDDPKKLKH